ncbi:MAG: zf-HC2 domain-containing protein [Edaphobacter sp.]
MIERQVVQVADFNQFGSAKPGGPDGPGNSQHCAQCEAMLSDALDGALQAADQATFDLHMAGCPSCASMFADAQRGAAWMELLKSPRPEPPNSLLDRILAQTSGQATTASNAAIVLGSNDRLRIPNTLLGAPSLVPAHAAFVSARVLPFRTRLRHGFRSLGQTMLQPRLAMTAAMAFFSIALTLNLTGVRVTALRISDLKPSSLMRSAYEAKAKVVRYSDNLRVVYELESRVRDLQRSSDDDGTAGAAAAPADQSNPSANPNPDGTQQPANRNRKPDSQKKTKPNPGSSRRETPSGGIQFAEFVQPSVPPPSSSQAFVVLNPSVKQEGGLV